LKSLTWKLIIALFPVLLLSSIVVVSSHTNKVDDLGGEESVESNGLEEYLEARRLELMNLIDEEEIDPRSKISEAFLKEIEEGPSTDTFKVWVHLPDILRTDIELELISHKVDPRLLDEDYIQSLLEANRYTENEVIALRNRIAQQRLTAVRSIAVRRNEAFITQNKINDEDIVYFGEYSTSLILNLNREEILRILEDRMVTRLTPFVNQQLDNHS